ncbi:MAG: FAD-binding oxidoreductase [Ferruginibacter sp.]
MPGNINRKKFLQLSMLAPLSLAARPFNFLSKEDTACWPRDNDNVTYYKPGDVPYEQLRKGFNKRIDKHPAIIALCRNTNGVSEAIVYAAKNSLPVAVKSGGHCMEGFSSNNGGMVINLYAMKTIEWLDEETVKLSPACTLAEIYNSLLPKKRIIPGGSCAGVGIGGLVLGGGYGLMARKFGLTCDSLQAATMVDGKGNIISSSEDPELLWGCRGGNNGNFGVATELVFKTHKAPATMQSFRFRAYKVNAERARSVLQKWFELTATLPEDCFSAFVLNGKTLYILLTNVGKQTAVVKNFITGLKSITDKTTGTASQPLARALKTYYGKTAPLYFKNASAGLYKNFTEIESFIEKALDIVVSTPGMIYQVNTLGGNIQNTTFEQAASFPHRAYPYFSELQTYWDLPSQQQRLMERFEQVQQVFSGAGIAAQYRNYPDLNFANSQDKYYGASYKRLQQLKNKYDPADLFRYEQSIKGL